MPPSLKILYEDNHLLAVEKSAGWPTMGVSAAEQSLVKEVKSYLKQKYNKPGNVYLGVVSRLDAVTTGVVLFARTSKAAKRLSEMFRTHNIEKTYLAIVEGCVQPESGSYHDWILKDEAHRRMRTVPSRRPGAKTAKLSYSRLKWLDDDSVVQIRLETGRKHQIRVQFASRGHAVLGDRKYGSRKRFPAGIALHARQLALTHPVKRTRLVIKSSPPRSWKPYWSDDDLA